MQRIDLSTKSKILELRQVGYSYGDIQKYLNITMPKSTMSYICRNIKMSSEYNIEFSKSRDARLVYARKLALIKNKEILAKRIEISKKTAATRIVETNNLEYVALAMLYWGEGGKWPSRSGLYLGSSDVKMVKTYIHLLNNCYSIQKADLRARVQIRHSQNEDDVKKYWSDNLGIPIKNFYKTYKDKRTIGKETTKTDSGVCAITCAGADIQLELKAIADIIVDTWGISAVG